MKFPVFDLHCDTALALLGKDLRVPGDLKKNHLHIDLERAGALPGYAQCFACFTTPAMQEWYHVSPETVFQREMDAILAATARYGDSISQAFSSSEIRTNREKGRMSAILTIEGPAGFGFDPALLEDLWNAGFRISTLGWNEQNPLTGSHQTGGGLTEQGKEYIREAQRLGMIVDVSHISDEGFWDIMDMTQAPVIASHSNSRAVCNVTRNLTDDMFREICRTGGVAGLNQYSRFISAGAADLNRVCDHVLHFLELDPDGTHIALGGDLDGCETLSEGFRGIESYPDLASRLLERGVDEKILMNLFWNNALGVMDRCCM